MWKAARLPSWIKRLVFIVSVSQYSLKDAWQIWKTKIQKSEPAGKVCDHGHPACMAFYTKPHPWVGNVCSLSFQFLPEGYNFVTWHSPLKHFEQTMSCMIVYMGKGFGRNLRLWYIVTPNGERFPGNWTVAETQEFKKGKKVNVSLSHWNKLLTVD